MRLWRRIKRKRCGEAKETVLKRSTKRKTTGQPAAIKAWARPHRQTTRPSFCMSSRAGYFLKWSMAAAVAAVAAARGSLLRHRSVFLRSSAPDSFIVWKTSEVKDCSHISVCLFEEEENKGPAHLLLRQGSPQLLRNVSPGSDTLLRFLNSRPVFLPNAASPPQR